MRALLLMLAVSAAQAQPRELQKLLSVGDDAYANGLFADALGAYQDAYLVSQEPSVLLRIGSCYEHLHDAAAAAVSFRRYLERQPTLSGGERTGIEARIAALEGRPARPEPSPMAQLTAAAPPPRTTGLRRAVVGSAVATAALALVAGGLTIGAAAAYGQLGADCRAQAAGCNDDAAARVASLNHSADSMWALAAAGVVATVTLHLVLRHRRNR
jgi:hypothetical protein